jgi:hypothetical protein
MLFFGFNYVVYESRCVVVLNPLPLINLPKQQQQSGKYNGWRLLKVVKEGLVMVIFVVYDFCAFWF